MVVTGATCEAQIRHTLGLGADGVLAPGLSPLQVANETGHILTGLREWKWTVGASTTLAFVANQNWVALPSGVHEIVSIHMTNGLTETIQVTTLEDVLDWRTSSVPTPLHYRVAVAFGPEDDRPSPRFEVFPTPSLDDATAISIFYRSGWTELTSGESVASIPVWLEPLYYQLLRAVARGYEEEDVEDMGSRIARVKASPIYMAAADRDTAIQSEYGQLRNGAANGRKGSWDFLRRGTLADPS